MSQDSRAFPTIAEAEAALDLKHVEIKTLEEKKMAEAKNDFSFSFDGPGNRKVMVRIVEEAAWLENELGEKAPFESAKEMTDEIYIAIDNLFLSKKRG